MVIYQTNTLKDLFCSSIEIKKWESGFLHHLSENWPSAACSRDRSELWILHLHWSQTFEESFSSQGCLQLTSSEDHFPSCLCGLTIVSMVPPLPALLFSFLSAEISCYLFCSYIPLYIIVSYFQLESLRDRRFSCLRISWNSFLSLVFDPDTDFLFLTVSLSWPHHAEWRFLVLQGGWNTYGPCAGEGQYPTTAPPEKSPIQITWVLMPSQLTPLIIPSSPFHSYFPT